MAKISGLPLAQNLTGDEQLPIVQAGETRGATMTALRALITPFLQNWYKGDRGEVGTSGNTYTPESGGIVAFKASDVSRGKASLLRLPGVADGDVYWKPGDATPDDGQNYFSSTFPGAIGRWARQGVGGVAFRQSLAGAIVRSAEDKLRDMVSAKDFGAKGDGQTNDTLAINRAIDTGKSVFFPTGVYPYDPSAKALAFGQYL
ncbi:MAG TPA: glycosyl hydrolase family 28-related protein, partial [Sphingomonas sp.]|nr:glycosyl hydrolase family 28-related protein [Sphingomonas sp.]